MLDLSRTSGFELQIQIQQQLRQQTGRIPLRPVQDPIHTTPTSALPRHRLELFNPEMDRAPATRGYEIAPGVPSTGDEFKDNWNRIQDRQNTLLGINPWYGMMK